MACLRVHCHLFLTSANHSTLGVKKDKWSTNETSPTRIFIFYTSIILYIRFESLFQESALSVRTGYSISFVLTYAFKSSFLVAQSHIFMVFFSCQCSGLTSGHNARHNALYYITKQEVGHSEHLIYICLWLCVFIFVCIMLLIFIIRNPHIHHCCGKLMCLMHEATSIYELYIHMQDNERHANRMNNIYTFCVGLIYL